MSDTARDYPNSTSPDTNGLDDLFCAAPVPTSADLCLAPVPTNANECLEYLILHVYGVFTVLYS
jgi:hypothetical protein